MADKLRKYEQIIIETLREYADIFNQQRDGLEAKVISCLDCKIQN